ncbi:MAG: hypothetical protein GXP17_08190 [Gammaproteobacteria bacterium]|nr:hypothetical protein [Gammaproteobacteria bacterium]
MNKKISENINILRQGNDLLHDMDDSIYRRCSDTVFKSSIGSHVRHNLDHYTSFFAGLESGKINYENRQRNSSIETNRNAAMALIAETCNRLENVNNPAKEQKELEKLQLWVTSGSNGEGMWAATSMSRELEFLMSHTIHHYAIVSIMCRLEGLAVEKDFGVAPSTLRYWNEPNGQCAH